MSGEMPYVWACYIITWVGLGTYAFTLIRRIRHAEQDLEDR